MLRLMSVPLPLSSSSAATVIGAAVADVGPIAITVGATATVGAAAIVGAGATICVAVIGTTAAIGAAV
eukprot:scaffold229439_cov29-Tisochrysis_lutea.AAC.2